MTSAGTSFKRGGPTGSIPSNCPTYCSFLEPDTFIGAPMTDTGRGTFLVSGLPVTDDETLNQLDMADDEGVISVPKREDVLRCG